MIKNRDIFITTLLLLFSILFFGLSDSDIIIQDTLYDFQTHMWVLDKHTQPYAFIFYTGLKKLLLFFALLLLLLFIFFRKHPSILPYHKGLIIVILSSIIVPLVTVEIKKYSNMPCPKHEIYYGGEYPHTTVWESYKVPYNKLENIECWPAGHASGGFAFMSLFFLFRRKRNRYIALGTAIVIGWSMGIYKMLIGDHFFSHTLITMLLSWLIILIIVKIVQSTSTLSGLRLL